MTSVAVITRTKNRTLLLRRAVNSVLNQTHQDWVHVIVNDGGAPEPIDQLLKPLENRYSGRLIVIHNSNSLGMEAASNKGINSSQSKYIAIHDDDDSWDPLFLSSCVEELESTPFPLIKGVVTHTTTIHEAMTEKGVDFLYSHPFDVSLNSITLPFMSEVNRFMPISFVFSREAWENVGAFDETLPVIGDWEFNLRYLLKYDIKVIKKPLANYHIREVAKSVQYKNTVTAGKDLHEFYRSIIINKHIRNGLTNPTPEAGYLLMLGDYFHRLNGGIWRLNNIIDQIKQLTPIRIMRRLFSK